MRKRNWKQYNRQLVQRGSITFLLDPKLFKMKSSCKQRGRPLEFSDQLIVMFMMIKIHYRITYRTLQGFMESILTLREQHLAVPSYSLVCKRAGFIKASLP